MHPVFGTQAETVSKPASCLLLAMDQTTQLEPGAAQFLDAAAWALPQQETGLEPEFGVPGGFDQLVDRMFGLDLVSPTAGNAEYMR